MTKTQKPKTKRTPNPKVLRYEHKKFVEEYLLDFNGTRAYMAVYGDKKRPVAASGSTEILRRPDVKAYLEKRKAERMAELHIDQKYVVDKAREILESDYIGTTKYLTAEEINNMPLKARKLVQSYELVKKKTTYTDRATGGIESEETDTYKVKFMSKDKAHELLARFTGTNKKDNEINVNVKSFSQALADLDI